MIAVARIALPVAALALLAGCERGSDDNRAAEANKQVSAEGQAQPGSIRLKGSGIDWTFVVPKAIRGDVKADKNGKILYPGSTLQGIAVVGGEPNGKKGGDSEMEVGFATADSVDKVLAWYRDAARAKEFRVVGVRKEGPATIVQANQPDGHAMKVTLAPRPVGGTDGRLVIHHND
jgi:hypothetical protein